MPAKARTFSMYGMTWEASTLPLQVEFFMIRHGGYYLHNGQTVGRGLFEHFMAVRKLIWPDRYRHRWSDLIYHSIIDNNITILMGAASTQKTSHATEFVLIDYWASPDNTATLVSSTTRDKLDAAVFGEIKMLWSQGKERFPWLAGHPVDSKQAILTDNIDDVEVRDFRKGIICKPCFVGQRYVGLGVFSGIKQERFRFLCDELQFMAPTFLDCLPNMRSNTGKGGLKVIGSGNPNHDPESQLGIVAEPVDGWQTVEDNEKTSTWPIKLTGGVCVNLIGPDSPNFDVGPDEPQPFYRLIGREFERIIAHDYGKNSPTYETQVMGRMRLGLADDRVITRQLCRNHHAHDTALWAGTERTRIYAADPAYGGGDRCVVGWAEFGSDIKGKIILRINPPHTLKINVKDPRKPEDQIAQSIKEEMDGLGIPAGNGFYDSFGRGTLGFSFARAFGADCPVPVDAGAQPTKRPVRNDLFVDDNGEKRLKRCDEHYSKFITEMWFSVRYAIEAEQIRELPEDVMQEGCWRRYYSVAGNKFEVEPKDDMKARLGKSPDLFDWLAILLEGCRQKGFRIDRIGYSEEHGAEDDWAENESDAFDRLIASKMLKRAAA